MRAMVLCSGRRALLLVPIALLVVFGELGVAAAQPPLRRTSAVPLLHLSALPQAVAGARLVVPRQFSSGGCPVGTRLRARCHGQERWDGRCAQPTHHSFATRR
jgi:hypothetical protein